MLTVRPNIDPVKKTFPGAKERTCPNCGAVMSEIERVTENQTTFIWYECSHPGCDGQWLQKQTARMGVA